MKLQRSTTAAERLVAHKIKMRDKAARRIGWHAAAQDNMKFHPKPQAETKPHHKSAKPKNKAATPATVGEYK